MRKEATGRLFTNVIQDFLKHVQHWRDMPTTGKYSEHYVQLDDGPAPVGVVIARELRDE